MSETLQSEPHQLDEVMLAMDVVDTLRHEAGMLEHDLSAPDREQKLIDRLREIYDAQGIAVPDEILREGVKAMDDHRFAYSPQKSGLFSKAYITRAKWGKPLMVFVGMIAMAWGVNYAAFEMPKKAHAQKQEKALTIDLPKSLEEARADGLALAATPQIKTKIALLYEDGITAAKAGDFTQASAVNDALTSMNAELRQTYNLRIVSRPDEYSGVFRINDASSGARNYYLIVEGIDASGKRVKVNIISEEDQKTKRTNIWGVRVPEAVFKSVAADKRDDQILQNAQIGVKKRGYLNPEYTVDTSDGLILEW